MFTTEQLSLLCVAKWMNNSHNLYFQWKFGAKMMDGNNVIMSFPGSVWKSYLRLFLKICAVVFLPEWRASGVSCAFLQHSCTQWGGVCYSHPPGTCCHRHQWWDWGARCGAAEYWCSKHSEINTKPSYKQTACCFTVHVQTGVVGPSPAVYAIQVLNYAANEACSWVFFQYEREICEADLHALKMHIYTAFLTEHRLKDRPGEATKEAHC